MILNKKIFIGMLLLFAFILSSNLLSASYMTSNVQAFQFTSSTETSAFNQAMCQQGNDFLIQITPFGCSPAVVRTDLLEENNVPVLCQLGATKINPLIDVEAIDSISFSGTYPKEVAGIGFHPAKSALGVQGDLNTPVLGNIGYVVITLRKQANASAIPDYISGNLTAKIKYNVKNAFGIGNALFYLPEFPNDKEWEAKKYQYSFWNGKGYVKADGISTDGAQISVYANDEQISSVSLKKGETSNNIYIPGFECQAGLKLKLESVENADTRAQLRINAEVVEVAKDEKFLENKCQVKSLIPSGIVQKVSIKCQEDTGVKNFDLTISPKIILKIGNEPDRDVGLGEFLYKDGARSVYLGYMGTTGEANKENLFIYLVSMPNKNDEKLSEDELSSVSSVVTDLVGAGQTSKGLINELNDKLKVFVGLSATLGRAIASQQFFYRINFNDKNEKVSWDNSLAGNSVSIIDFAEAQDQALPSDVQSIYNNAKEDYETLRESFSSEVYQKTGTYGEEALYKEIMLAWMAEQKKTASDLCKEFSESYPNSKKEISECKSASKLSSSEVGETYVTINGEVKRISLDGISEPTFKDYGVKIVANTPKETKYFELRKGQYIAESGISLQLISSQDTSAKLQISVTTATGATKTEVVELNKDITNTFTEGYSFTLMQVNLNKVAKVSVLSNINNAGTQTDFSFKIGIEKRAIELSPDQIKKTINKLNKSIGTWENISGGLGNVTQTLKTACLATSAALIVKNFLLNAEGAGIARQMVMRGEGGWYNKCKAISAQKGISLDQCFSENAATIDKEVGGMSTFMTQQNNKIKELEKGFTTPNFLSEDVINTEGFANEYKKQVSTCLQNLPETSFADPNPNKKGESINKADILKALSLDYSKGVYTVEELRNIELFCMSRGNSNLKELSDYGLYSVLSDVQTTSKESLLASSFDEQLRNSGFTSIGATNSYGDERAIKGRYDGGTIAGSQLGGLDATKTYPATAITYNSKKYILVLQESSNGYFIDKVYDGDKNLVSDADSAVIKSAFSVFQKYDISSYKNKYLNPEVKYYETEPYKGMPAIVPFDLTNGWYAAIKQTIPVGSNIQSYEASGRVSSFWVCNVGKDGKEENLGGDDICEQINTQTGQAYDQFPGITDKEEARRIIKNAQTAVEKASKQTQRTGYIDIFGQKVKIGLPAADIPDFQCQDFMSPDDCLLIFNLCDPVICPSSRCNLGGAYPVRDVVQSGVIGSIALCLPNAREGIAIPVCLTGIKAGIDGFLSIEKSYRDCLQESLNTGKMVGICDEIYSIYICDFFWRQALPFADLVIPKIMASLLGQNARGGGEYLGVADAWQGADKAINYFVNYYGANSKNAFLARSTESFGDDVCKLYASATVPSGADFLNQLTSPDSPVQFHGRFDETTLTTATVPPTSHYKVFYHIYAGQDSGAYYQVYLKGAASSSYYHDTSSNYMVASGYVAVGGYASETKDFTATSGYKEMCINVNGQEECGFKEVSTSFAVNYVKDLYLAEQANQTGITTESECVSGTASAYNLLNPNVQSAAESVVNPAIYNQGIIRVCASANPGQGTDPYAGTSESRWRQVGICGSNNIKCWLDSQSIKDVIKTTTVEGETLDETSDNYLKILQNEGNYLGDEEYKSKVAGINKEIDMKRYEGAVTLINEIMNKVFWSSQKAELYYLRGNAFADMLNVLLGKIKLGIVTGKLTKEDILKLTDARQRVLEAAKLLEHTVVSGEVLQINGKTLDKINKNCFTSIYYGVYLDYAGVDKKCIYSDSAGTKYTINGHTITIGSKEEGGDGKWLFPGTYCQTISKEKKLDSLQPGDMIFYVWDENYDHTAIFIEWTNKANHIAKLFDWNYEYQGKYGISLNEKDTNGKTCSTGDVYYNENKQAKGFCAVYRYYTVDLSDNKHPVYVYQEPYILGQQAAVSAPKESPVVSTDPKEVTAEQNSFFSWDRTGTVQKSTPSVKVTIEEIPVKVTLGTKIWQQAGIIAVDCLSSNSGSCTDNSAKFVSRALKNAGVTGIEVSGTVSGTLPTSVSYLTSLISKRNDFIEVNVDQNLESGDILLIGKGCQTDYSVAVFSTFGLNDNSKISFYTNFGSKIKLETAVFVTKIDDGALPIAADDKAYFYKAYRYTGDTKEVLTVRTKWTLVKAIEEANKRRGTYRDNQVFGDQVIFDGLLTEKECNDFRYYAPILGTGQKDMAWLKKLLLSKCATDSFCRTTYGLE